VIASLPFILPFAPSTQVCFSPQRLMRRCFCVYMIFTFHSFFDDVSIYRYVAPPSGRAGLDGFLSADLMQHGFTLISAQLAPTEYGHNPLESGDETQAFLHFSELTAPYMLYVFQKTGRSSSSNSSSEFEGSIPPGHTPFSWLPRPANHTSSSLARPPGHSAFSWPLK
jgi:hypothetical protein